MVRDICFLSYIMRNDDIGLKIVILVKDISTLKFSKYFR